MALSNLSPSLHQPLSYPPAPPHSPSPPPRPPVPVGLNKKWGLRQIETFVTCTFAVCMATTGAAAKVKPVHVGHTHIHACSKTLPHTHTHLFPSLEIEEGQCRLWPCLLTAPRPITSCHLLFSIQAHAPHSRPCHRGDGDPRGICYRSRNTLSPVSRADNILTCSDWGESGLTHLHDNKLKQSGRNKISFLKDLLTVQINSYSISKLPTGSSERKKKTKKNQHYIFRAQLMTGPMVPLAER